MQAPCFWYKNPSFLSRILKPFGYIYGFFTARRLKKGRPYQVDIPVLCVGNISVGGTGKTPVCLALADLIRKRQKQCFFLNHGYKSRLKNVLVDPTLHSALDVGDEALLLSQKAPTIVDNQRDRGAKLAVRHKAQCLIMDDGFQNPTLKKTLSFVVVDGGQGFGNMCLLPAGPLREPVLSGLKRANAIIIVGEDKKGIRSFLTENNVNLPILTGSFVIHQKIINQLKRKRVFAFAGIGNPYKFFDMLSQKEIVVEKTQIFPDHYQYTRFDMEKLFQQADNLVLVTTTKDYVKIPKEFQSKIIIVDGSFKFDNEQQISVLLDEVFYNE